MYIAWVLLLFMVQIPFPSTLVVRRRFGPAGVLPAWNFFAPRPIVSDLFIEARGARDGHVGKWAQVYPPRERTWGQAFVNTERRSRKMLFDAAVTVATAAARVKDPRHLLESYPYLLVLNASTSAQRQNDVDLLQFRLVRVTDYYGTARRSEVYRSPWHRCSPESVRYS